MFGPSWSWWRLNGGEAWIGDGIENDKEWSARDSVQRALQASLSQHGAARGGDVGRAFWDTLLIAAIEAFQQAHVAALQFLMRRVILWRPVKIRRAQIIGLGMAAEPFLDGEERLPMVLSFGHHGPHRLHPFLLLGGLRTLQQRLQNSAVQPIDRLRRRFEADEIVDGGLRRPPQLHQPYRADPRA